MDFLPSSVAINIPLPNGGSFPILWYGILLVSGALVAAYISSLDAKRRGINADHIWNGLLAVFITGVIGARLYHVISSPTGTNVGLQYYLNNPVEILNIRAGGLGIYGAIGGGVLGLYLYCRYAKVNFMQFVDMAFLGVLFGQAIGRWGNFFNQELYGYPTDLPWGISIDAAHRLPLFGDLTKYPVETTRFTPTFLYESLLALGAGLFLVYASRRWSNRLKTGDMFLLWGMLYGVVRFLTEFQRPDAWLISGIPAAQIIALFLIVLCGVAYLYRHTGPSKAATAQATARRRQRRSQ